MLVARSSLASPLCTGWRQALALTVEYLAVEGPGKVEDLGSEDDADQLVAAGV